MATDSQNRVYVFQRKDPPVMIFDRDGNYLNSWGISAITDHHVIFIEDDIMYVTDQADSVALKFTLDGKPLQVIGRRSVHSDTDGEVPREVVPQSSGPFNYPTQLVPAPSGDLYTSDGYRNARVHRFSPDGRLMASWGEPEKEGPSQFHLPHSVLVGRDGLVYVCDRENNRIQVFTREGRFITMWTDLRRPLDISSNADGILHVSEGGVDGLSPRVSFLTKQGQVVARWDSMAAHGSWVDAHVNIYMALGPAMQVDKYVKKK